MNKRTKQIILEVEKILNEDDSIVIEQKESYEISPKIREERKF